MIYSLTQFTLQSRYRDEEERLSGNRRNGYNRKQVQTSLGEVTVHTPRDSYFRLDVSILYYEFY
jgi:transposase-like protein